METCYFKQLDDDGASVSIMTYDFRPTISNPLIIEITEEEYNILLAEIQAADALVQDEISDEEALNIILGVSE